eukprot:3615474-Ditylum_brightwellii.AAC.1
MMEPITQLTCDNKPFIWGEEQKAAFQEIKWLVAESMMLVYPHLDNPFDSYPDACNVQIGGFLVQGGFTLGCFSYKMNTAQKNYPMVDKK